MEYTTIREGIKISKLSFGTSRLGKAAFEDNTKKGIPTLEKTWELGIRLFDTASNYSYGDSEKILGQFVNLKKDEIIISTKGGTLPSKYGRYAQYAKPFFSILRPFLKNNKKSFQHSKKRTDFSEKYLRSTLERSLNRLKLDTVQLYKLHNPHEETLKGKYVPSLLNKFKSENKVVLGGISVLLFEDLYECDYLNEIDVVQFPLNFYNFKPKFEDKLLELKEKGIALIGRMPFHRGLLTKTNEINTGGKKGFTDEKFIQKKQRIIEQFGITDIQLALWFLKDMNLLDSILFSSFNEMHIQENVKLYNKEVPDSFSWKDLI